MNQPPESTSIAYADDEISLRDLYLILRKGLPFIIGAALLAGIITFAVSSFMPDIYQAESSTIVVPSTLTIRDGGGLSFSPQASVPFESYETLALSRPVLEATLESLGETELTVEQLRGGLSLTRLLGPPEQRPESAQAVPLSVTHRVRNSDSERAARIGNAWTEQSLATVRDALLSNLTPVDTVTRNQLRTLDANLQAAQAALEQFEQANNLDLLELRFESYNTRLSAKELELLDLETELAAAEARQATLGEQLAGERLKTPTTSASSDAFLAGRSLEEVHRILDEQLALARSALDDALATRDRFDEANNLPYLEARIAYLLTGRADTDSVRVELENDLLRSLPALQQRLRTLPLDIAQAEARASALQGAEAAAARAELAALEAELAQLPDLIATTEAQLEDLQTRFVSLASERSTLELAVESAAETYQETLLQRQQLELGQGQSAGRSLRESEASSPVLTLERLLREESLAVNALQAQTETLRAQLEEDRQVLAAIQQERATLTQRAAQLSLAYDTAEAAYQEIIRFQPVTSYITELAPASALIISRAAVPTQPVGPRRTLNALVATLLVGLIATLFVFLREAVSGPADPALAAAQRAQPRARA